MATSKPAGIVPVGCVIARLTSYTNIPALPDEFVACNGQTLSDSQSPFNGQVIPNLNASGGGSQRFLRGSTTSGGTGGSDNGSFSLTATASCGVCDNVASGGDFTVYDYNNPLSVNGTASGSILPSYYQVTWIMRIK